MDFFTDFFCLQQAKNDPRNRAVLAIINTMSAGERREIKAPPPDFPRKARESAAW
ncbi:MAG: hypothetical protein L0I29_09865 [Hyphomicrobiales bacterium]|nr:hypothetical protein [Hyphomicrobiales bacterium]